MAGLDPAIGYPRQFANDAIPGSNQAPKIPTLAPTSWPWRMQCVNSKGGWYYSQDDGDGVAAPAMP
jgi:hypothetical protein